MQLQIQLQTSVTLTMQVALAHISVSFHGCAGAACMAVLLTDSLACKVSVGPVVVVVAGMIGTRLPAAFLVLFKGGFTWREQTFMAFSWIPKVPTALQVHCSACSTKVPRLVAQHTVLFGADHGSIDSF